jgi:hypothetical protein
MGVVNPSGNEAGLDPLPPVDPLPLDVPELPHSSGKQSGAPVQTHPETSKVGTTEAPGG